MLHSSFFWGGWGSWTIMHYDTHETLLKWTLQIFWKNIVTTCMTMYTTDWTLLTTLYCVERIFRILCDLYVYSDHHFCQLCCFSLLSHSLVPSFQNVQERIYLKAVRNLLWNNSLRNYNKITTVLCLLLYGVAQFYIFSQDDLRLLIFIYTMFRSFAKPLISCLLSR